MATSKKSSTSSPSVDSILLEKIVVNVGVGRTSQQSGFKDRILPQIMGDVAMLTGQTSQKRPAKKSVAGFKLREGVTVGLRVTLRGKKMVDFFNRLTTIVLPRVHDFRGIDERKVDQGGALHIGFREQFVFPEIDPEESLFVFPLGINIVPLEKDREKALEAYRSAGVPFKKS